MEKIPTEKKDSEKGDVEWKFPASITDSRDFLKLQEDLARTRQGYNRIIDQESDNKKKEEHREELTLKLKELVDDYKKKNANFFKSLDIDIEEYSYIDFVKQKELKGEKRSGVMSEPESKENTDLSEDSEAEDSEDLGLDLRLEEMSAGAEEMPMVETDKDREIEELRADREELIGVLKEQDQKYGELEARIEQILKMSGEALDEMKFVISGNRSKIRSSLGDLESQGK